MAKSSYKFRRYSLSKRNAYIAAVLKVRDAGGRWAEALKATRRLGFKGDVSYLRVLVARSGTINRSISAIPESIQKRWKEQYIFLVKQANAGYHEKEDSHS
jgi:hypothetical protein